MKEKEVLLMLGEEIVIRQEVRVKEVQKVGGGLCGGQLV